jgi:hypothetical protein
VRLVLGFGGCTQVPLRRACFESLTMHPYHLRWYRYRRLLAAVMTLPALDACTPVPHEFSGQWPCCFNGCAEAGRYVHAAKPCMEPQSAMVLELADAALQSVEPIRCLIPGFDGAIFSLEWKEALWARFCTGTPQRQRQSVEQYKIVKRA